MLEVQVGLNWRSVWRRPGRLSLGCVDTLGYHARTAQKDNTVVECSATAPQEPELSDENTHALGLADVWKYTCRRSKQMIITQCRVSTSSSRATLMRTIGMAF